MRKLTVQENIALGYTYLTKYRAIRNFLFQTPEQIRAYQFKKIQQLITLAFNETEFYREKYTKAGLFPQDIKTWEDFEKIPTTTKSEMIEAGESCVVKSKRGRKDLIVSKSSGSSGTVINVLEDDMFWIRGSLISLRMYQHAFDCKATDKQVLIFTSKIPFDSILGFYRSYYINTLTPIDKIVAYLLKIKPEFIVSYPSILLDIIKMTDETTLSSIRPKAISTNSEYLSQLQRDYIGKVFNCPVFDEFSSEELFDIAYQCTKKQYHLQEDCSYMEILDPIKDKKLQDGGIGEIVGTCLINTVMPFIRYRQGDLASITTDTCECTSNGRILQNIAARKNAYFSFKNGTQASSGRLLDWTYELILKHKMPILQFQLIQKNYDEIELNVIPRQKENIKQFQSIVTSSFQKLFKTDSSITLNVVSKIESTKAGKHLPIVSRIQ